MHIADFNKGAWTVLFYVSYISLENTHRCPANSLFVLFRCIFLIVVSLLSSIKSEIKRQDIEITETARIHSCYFTSKKSQAELSL